MDKTIVDAVSASSAKWRAAFNAGDADGCASMYEESATMTALPFGTYTGRKAIREFWAKLIADDFTDVEYINPKTVTLAAECSSGVGAAIVSSEWRMNKAHGRISQELWVVQPSGDALLRVDEFEVANE